MWVVVALGSALFAGLTSIFGKIGMQDIDSNLATAIRTCVVIVFAWAIVAATGVLPQIASIAPTTWLFLVLSGLSTGASWLCYFRALRLGDVNRVVPVDRLSVALAMMLGFILLGEPFGFFQLAAVVLIGVGTWMMAVPKGSFTGLTGRDSWFLFALGSAVFASLTSIFGKIGIEQVDSNLGTAIRTVVVLIMAWMMVAVTWKGKGRGGKGRTMVAGGAGTKEVAIDDAKGGSSNVDTSTASIKPTIATRDWVFLVLSGLTTGLSWLCFFYALQIGPASGVVPIDKLSIIFTICFARIVLKEHLTRRSAIGLALIVLGTLAVLVA